MEPSCPTGCTRSADVVDTACQHGEFAPVAAAPSEFGVHIVLACPACDPTARPVAAPRYATVQCATCGRSADAAPSP